MRLAKITLAITGFVTITVFTLYAFNSGIAKQELDIQVPKLQSTEAKLKSVNVEYEQLNIKLEAQSSSDQETINKLNSEKEKLKQEQSNLQKQLQSRADEKARLAKVAEETANKVTATQKVSAASLSEVTVEGCGDNQYAHYIYMHESSCSTTATNSEGCTGIGQACPASKLTAACPNMDYACQNSFFTSYAVNRYGSWEAAYNVWLSQHWW